MSIQLVDPRLDPVLTVERLSAPSAPAQLLRPPHHRGRRCQSKFARVRLVAVLITLGLARPLVVEQAGT